MFWDVRFYYNICDNVIFLASGSPEKGIFDKSWVNYRVFTKKWLLEPARGVPDTLFLTKSVNFDQFWGSGRGSEWFIGVYPRIIKMGGSGAFLKGSRTCFL